MRKSKSPYSSIADIFDVNAEVGTCAAKPGSSVRTVRTGTAMIANGGICRISRGRGKGERNQDRKVSKGSDRFGER